MRCTISRSVLDAVQALAAADPAREVCGLLLGGEGAIEGFVPARNVDPDPASRFEIDPATLFAASRAERAGGARVAGYYHSHPTGDARPSRADAAVAQPDGRLWLIVAGEAALLWRAVPAGAVNGRFDPVEMDVLAVAAG